MKLQTHLWWVSVAAVVLSCAAASVVHADPNPEFAKANQHYSEGHFLEAVDGYQTLIESGHWNTTVFYNLGNAWFRLGNFGEAILNYERALALDPHHPEAAANLSLVRDEARALELKPGVLERYLNAATSTQYSIAASAAFWLALFALAHLFYSRRRSAALIAFAVFAMAIFAGAVYALYSRETGGKGRALAIVTGTNIEARLATADSASSVLALPPGSEIQVLSQRGDWIYAALPNGLRGWIPANGAQLVRL